MQWKHQMRLKWAVITYYFKSLVGSGLDFEATLNETIWVHNSVTFSDDAEGGWEGGGW
jgi:hypothetical protein